MADQNVKDHLAALFRHKLDLGPIGANEFTDAIEALIHEKLAELMEKLSEQIESAKRT